MFNLPSALHIGDWIIFSTTKELLMHVSLDSTESIHKNLKSLVMIHNLVTKGLYPGMAHKDIAESIIWLEKVHDIYLAEFRTRSDALYFEPLLNQEEGNV